VEARLVTRHTRSIETLRGEIAEVKLLRDSWGKIRLRAGSGDSPNAEVTGTVLGFEAGTTVECRGRWEETKWGRQFRALTIVTVIPADASGAIAWISSKLPGIGRKRATEIVERFGIPGLWGVLEHRPHELEAVRGITAETAARIADEYRRVQGEREEMVTLRGWGLTESQIKRCREVWKDRIVEELQRDPFQLCELVHGFGFVRADEVAMKMGIPADHPGRLRACLLHKLGEAEGAGHCYVPTGALVAIASRDLGVHPSLVRSVLDELVEGERVIAANGGARLYRATTYEAETELVEGVLELLTVPPAPAIEEPAPELERETRDGTSPARSGPATDQERAVEEALLLLAGMCDGAAQRDGVGFNGRDAAFGRELATRVAGGGRLSRRQHDAAMRMLRTYARTQIADLAPRIWPSSADGAEDGTPPMPGDDFSETEGADDAA
jgi:exodeoxyribonuclease V alpha subunit